MNLSGASPRWADVRNLFWAGLLGVGLAACGGSGGGDTVPPPAPPVAPPVSPPVTPPPTPPVTPPPGTFSVAFATTQVSLTADTGDVTVPEAYVSFTASNVPAGGLWYRWNQTGSAVAGIDLLRDSANGGRMRLSMRVPAHIGAGLHAATVRVEFCADASCSAVISGPHLFVVSYTVTGSPAPATRVNWGFGSSIASHHPVSQTTPVEKQLGFTVENLPPAGLWIGRVGAGDGIVTRATLSSVGFERNGAVAAGFLAITITPPASLGSGIFTGRTNFRACFDAQCERAVPGSEFELVFELVIYADEDFRHTRRALRPVNGANDVIWSATNGSLYVASSMGFNSEPRILRVDPAIGAVEQSALFADQMLGRLAVSADGSRLFVSSTPPAPTALRADSVVRRLTLHSLMEEAAITLDTAPGFAQVQVRDLVAIPGTGTSFMAALESNRADDGVYVYDAARKGEGVPRVSASFERGRYLTRGASPDIFHSLRRQSLPPFSGKVETLQVDESGVRVVGEFALNTETRAVHFADGRLYLLDGKVLDAGTGTPIGQLAIPARWTLQAMVVDAARSRAFGIAQNDYVLSFDTRTFELLALAPLGVSSQRATFDHPRMTLWGDDGLAVVDGTNVVLMSGPFFTTYAGEPTMPRP